MTTTEALVPVRSSPAVSPGVNASAAGGLAGALAGGLLFLVAHRGLSDDSYITIDYARNVAFHGHWGVLPSLTANTATSPLTVCLLAAITAVVRAPVLAAGLLLMATTAASAVWLARIAEMTRLSRWLLPTLGVALLLSSPLLASTIGLETYLCAALFIGLVRYALAGRWIFTGIVGGLLILGRPDLAVVDVVVVLIVAAARRHALRSGLVAGAVVVPWYLVSWFWLGSALPDTFFLKTHGDGWAGFHFASGPLWYWLNRPLAAALTFLVVVGGLVALVGWAVLTVRKRDVVTTRAGQGAVAFGLGGIAHASIFALLATPPSHWYYGPVVAGLGLCAVMTALVVVQSERATSPRGVAALGSVSLVVLAAVGYDVMRGVPWETPPIDTNWATTAEYQRVAEDISTMLPPGATVVSPNEVGVLAYFCDCEMVDFISDPGRTERDIAVHMQQSGPLMRQLLQLNYTHRSPVAPKPAEFELVWEETCVNAIGEWQGSYRSEALCLKPVLP